MPVVFTPSAFFSFLSWYPAWDLRERVRCCHHLNLPNINLAMKSRLHYIFWIQGGHTISSSFYQQSPTAKNDWRHFCFDIVLSWLLILPLDAVIVRNTQVQLCNHFAILLKRPNKKFSFTQSINLSFTINLNWDSCTSQRQDGVLYLSHQHTQSRFLASWQMSWKL
jgi:hypothetical protein